jgi:hypothetical protein
MAFQAFFFSQLENALRPLAMIDFPCAVLSEIKYSCLNFNATIIYKSITQLCIKKLTNIRNISLYLFFKFINVSLRDVYFVL